MRDVVSLTRMELYLFRILNRLRHTLDPKEKRRFCLLGVTWAILLVMAAVYVGGLVWGLVQMHLQALVPMYLTCLASLLLFFFGIFQAGERIFGQAGYDLLASMPIKPQSIVISRFLALYMEDILLTLLIFLPGFTVYALLCRPSIMFYPLALCGIWVVPAIPLVVSTLIGTLIAGVAARGRHTTTVRTILSLILVVAVLALSFSMASGAEELTLEMLATLAETLGDRMATLYPPAAWLGTALTAGKTSWFFLFLSVSVAAVISTVWLVTRYFHPILRRFLTYTAKHRYQMTVTARRGLLKTLFVREWKHYFSSTIYVTNTITGPIMGAMLAVTLFGVGKDAVLSAMPIDPLPYLPFVVGAVFTMMTTTAPSISIEGRQMWLVQSLPIPTKSFFDAKILLNLALMAPFYVLAEVFLFLALRPDWWTALWMLTIPVAIILFAVVCGITVNLRFCNLYWEKEEEVVKQGAASLIGGFAGPLVSLLCGGVLLVVPGSYADVVRLTLCVVLLLLTGWLYRNNNRADLRRV